MKEVKTKAILIFIVLFLFYIDLGSAFGISYSFLCPDDPVRLSPGETATIELTLQNMGNDEDIRVMAVLKDNAGIAEMEEKNYVIEANTKDTIVPVLIEIPESAVIGNRYNVVTSFDILPPGESGGVEIGTGMDVKICVEVVNKEAEQVPQLSPSSSKIIWLLGGIVFVLLVAIILFLKLRKKRL